MAIIHSAGTIAGREGLKESFAIDLKVKRKERHWIGKA
jgi:hypothetical protein